MPDTPEARIAAFRAAANRGGPEGHAEAVAVLKGMTDAEIAEGIVAVHSTGATGSDRQALREAAALFAGAKTADRVIAAVTALRNTGRGLTVVGIALAAIQAWPVVKGWLDLARK